MIKRFEETAQKRSESIFIYQVPQAIKSNSGIIDGEEAKKLL